MVIILTFYIHNVQIQMNVYWEHFVIQIMYVLIMDLEITMEVWGYFVQPMKIVD